MPKKDRSKDGGPILSPIEQIRANLAGDPHWYRQREDWGEEGPSTTYGAVNILLAEVDRLQEAEAECKRLLAAIRAHRDGQESDEALYSVLPEAYRERRLHPESTYVSPTMLIHDLQMMLHYWLKRVPMDKLSDAERQQFEVAYKLSNGESA